VVDPRSGDSPRISGRWVESVREKSAAAPAGWEKGGEIGTIPGATLNGLTVEEDQPVMRTPVYKVGVLRVRGAGRGRTEDGRIAVRK